MALDKNELRRAARGFNVDQPERVRVEIPPIRPPVRTPNRSGTAWRWLAFLVICLMVIVASQKDKPKEIYPAATPAKVEEVPRQTQASNADLSVDENNDDEEKPEVGTLVPFSAAQLRYCLSESIRIDGMNSVVEPNVPPEIAFYNSGVKDFNARCTKYKFDRSLRKSIEKQVRARRDFLELEGKISLFSFRSALNPASSATSPAQKKEESVAQNSPNELTQPRQPGAVAAGIVTGNGTKQGDAGSTQIPANAQLDFTGRNWACNPGFHPRNNQCVPFRIPANAQVDYTGRNWTCNAGYRAQEGECVQVDVPANAQLDYTGHRWVCNPGFNAQDGECVKFNVPANAQLDYTGRRWVCNPGFNAQDGECLKFNVPANAQLDYTGRRWVCNPGFNAQDGECVKFNVPANAQLDYTGRRWICNPGFNAQNGQCVKFDVPANAQIDYTGRKWTCNPGFSLQNKECVRF
jgi:hypothetical protein